MPLCILEETIACYKTQDAYVTDPTTLDWAEGHVLHYLEKQMVAGKVKLSEFSGSLADGIYQLDGKFFCTEMIGNKHSEEIFNHGQKH